VPPDFDAWFAKSCARDLEQRYASVREQMQALREVCGVTGRTSAAALAHTQPTLAPAEAPMAGTGAPVVSTRHSFSPQRSATGVAMAAAVVGLGLVGGAWYLSGSEGGTESDEGPGLGASTDDPPTLLQHGSSPAADDPSAPGATLDIASESSSASSPFQALSSSNQAASSAPVGSTAEPATPGATGVARAKVPAAKVPVAKEPASQPLPNSALNRPSKTKQKASPRPQTKQRTKQAVSEDQYGF